MQTLAELKWIRTGTSGKLQNTTQFTFRTQVENCPVYVGEYQIVNKFCCMELPEDGQPTNIIEN